MYSIADDCTILWYKKKRLQNAQQRHKAEQHTSVVTQRRTADTSVVDPVPTWIFLQLIKHPSLSHHSHAPWSTPVITRMLHDPRQSSRHRSHAHPCAAAITAPSSACWCTELEGIKTGLGWVYHRIQMQICNRISVTLDNVVIESVILHNHWINRRVWISAACITGSPRTFHNHFYSILGLFPMLWFAIQWTSQITGTQSDECQSWFYGGITRDDCLVLAVVCSFAFFRPSSITITTAEPRNDYLP